MRERLENSLPTHSVPFAKLHPDVAFMPPMDRQGLILRLVCVIANELAIADVNVMLPPDERNARLNELCENRKLSEDGWRLWN
jgi:hypothetical protein